MLYRVQYTTRPNGTSAVKITDAKPSVVKTCSANEPRAPSARDGLQSLICESGRMKGAPIPYLWRVLKQESGVQSSQWSKPSDQRCGARGPSRQLFGTGAQGIATKFSLREAVERCCERVKLVERPLDAGWWGR